MGSIDRVTVLFGRTDMAGYRLLHNVTRSLSQTSRTFQSISGVHTSAVTVPELDEVVGRVVAKYKGSTELGVGDLALRQNREAVVDDIKEEVETRWPGRDWKVSNFKSTYFIQSTGTEYTSRKQCLLE